MAQQKQKEKKKKNEIENICSTFRFVCQIMYSPNILYILFFFSLSIVGFCLCRDWREVEK